MLGIIAGQVGRSEITVDLIRRAIALDASIAEYHNNLGLALIIIDQRDEANRRI